MELSYWEARWNKDKTGFHMPGGYPGLKSHWQDLSLNPAPNILVPLCGKTPDLVQLEEYGASVAGVEISKKAVRDFFKEQNRPYETHTFAEFSIYRSGSIELWQGDFFKFPGHRAPMFDLVYDKAALVALPPERRKEYVRKIIGLSGRKGSILLHHFIYPQEQMPGPPFSVSSDEIESYFSTRYHIKILEKNSLPAANFPPFQRRGLQSPLEERLLYITPAS